MTLPLLQVVREVQNVDRLKLDLNQKGIIDAVNKNSSNNNNNNSNNNNNRNNNKVANSVIGSDGVKTHLAGNVDWQTNKGKQSQNQQFQNQQQGSTAQVGYKGTVLSWEMGPHN